MLNDWLSAIILGVVEGLTEFIPVSSTGHLLLTREALGLTDPFWGTFVVLIQLGAILGVVALYFARLWSVLIRLPTDPSARHFAISIAIAFLPAVVLGFLLHDFIKQVLFESPLVICWSLVLGGIVLLVIDRWPPTTRLYDAMRYPWWTSFGIGLFQVLSMVPGVSRSGATIVGALLLGGDRRSAAEFSFFLAIPTMVGAFAYDFYENRDAISFDQAGLIGIGFVVSFISGMIVIKTMLDFVSKRGYALFGWWRLLVGIAGLAIIYLA